MNSNTVGCVACNASPVGVCDPCERIRDERHLEACEARAKCGASRAAAYTGESAAQRGFWAAMIAEPARERPTT